MMRRMKVENPNVSLGRGSTASFKCSGAIRSCIVLSSKGRVSTIVMNSEKIDISSESYKDFNFESEELNIDVLRGKIHIDKVMFFEKVIPVKPKFSLIVAPNKDVILGVMF